MDPAKLLLFTTVTASVSIVPGPQMVFVLTQSAWRGHRAGFAALGGLQLGNLCWFAAAGLGLGTLALAWPRAIGVLAAAGALYLAWLGWQAIAGARRDAPHGAAAPRSRHALRDSLAIALGNPKSLVYVLALLPPFLDFSQPLASQLMVLAAIAVACDMAVGVIYVAAGSGLAAAMSKPVVRLWLERVIGTIFLILAAGILVELVRGGGRIA
ncbi:LysE family translocator [Croceibacterium sp. TMG7-5b_MA50]|uniref:LysE family translocator n=1 Tax=Croceibacterium sp. TMG7-5b_MA50 TaxID=3121290 RepID=UPI003221DB69